MEYYVDPLNNTFKIQNLQFQFDKILDQEISQQQTYEQTQYLIDKFLQGYNTECFTYGATGSGKSYTISGSSSYESRGIIPRTLEYLLSHQFNNNNIKFYISYCQIYNDLGYDLLSYENNNLEPVSISQLQQFEILEVQPNVMKFRNLSKHEVKTIDQAINILFQGDLNKMILQTSQNNLSSRSHCIFSIYMEKYEENQIIKSKYNIIDLAGCERAAIHGEKGLILQQANFINVSLFHLELVISELQKHSQFIPYRNSLLTRYLKDSLGGNSITMMIACISSENYDLYQTIQTCQFAMRVQNIQNTVSINIETDYKLLSQQLQQENIQLKQQIVKLQTNQERNTYTDDELYNLSQQYIDNNIQLELTNQEWQKVIQFVKEILITKYQQYKLQNQDIEEQQTKIQNIQVKNTQEQDNSKKIQNNQKQSNQQMSNYIDESLKYCAYDITQLDYNALNNQNNLCQIYQQNCTLLPEGNQLQETIQQLKQQKDQLYKQIQQIKQKAEQLKIDLFTLIQTNGQETDESDAIKQQLIQLNNEYKELNQNYKQQQFNLQQNKLKLTQIKEQIKQNFNQWIQCIKSYCNDKIKQLSLDQQIQYELNN